MVFWHLRWAFPAALGLTHFSAVPVRAFMDCPRERWNAWCVRRGMVPIGRSGHFKSCHLVLENEISICSPECFWRVAGCWTDVYIVGVLVIQNQSLSDSFQIQKHLDNIPEKTPGWLSLLTGHLTIDVFPRFLLVALGLAARVPTCWDSSITGLAIDCANFGQENLEACWALVKKWLKLQVVSLLWTTTHIFWFHWWATRYWTCSEHRFVFGHGQNQTDICRSVYEPWTASSLGRCRFGLGPCDSNPAARRIL